jgi:hypothetical protein
MKKLTWLITLLAAGPAWGLQSATNMSYQGKLLDANGVPQNDSFNMIFAIHPAASGAATLWSETIEDVPVSNGVFSVQLGNVTPIPADIFASSPTYLSVDVGDGEMTPRQLLSASPYAFSAARLASDGAVIVNSGLSFSTFTSAGGLFLPGGLTASTGTLSGQDASGYSLKLSSGVTMPAGTVAANVVQSAAGVFTGSGGSVYSVASSSGIRMNAGTLSVSGSGIDAAGTGVKAATATFTRTGNDQYSLLTSSGISMAAGTLRLASGSGGLDAGGAPAAAATVRLTGSAGDPTGADGLMAYNTVSQRFRCYENGAWTNCVKRPESVSFGGYQIVTNIGANYDAVVVSSGLGTAYMDFTDATSVVFTVRVNKVGTGTQSWQLWDATNGAEIGVINDAGAAGHKVLTETFNAGLPTGLVLVRVRGKSTTAGDDPVYFGSAMIVYK